MIDTKKEIENLKTEAKRLKIKIRKIENFLLSIPSSEEYIHEDNSQDDLLEEAREAVKQYDRASASLIQRRLSIGYSRAAKILDQLEAAGVVGPAEGSKPREVFKEKKK